jgi:predicted nucleotidyltransferase
MSKKQIEKEIKSITRQLIGKYKPEKIILFGSAVRGKFGPDSDLDFLIVKKNVPEYGHQRMYQVRKLIKKNLPADFLIYRPEELEELINYGEPFTKLILEEGRILYG